MNIQQVAKNLIYDTYGVRTTLYNLSNKSNSTAPDSIDYVSNYIISNGNSFFINGIGGCFGANPQKGLISLKAYPFDFSKLNYERIRENVKIYETTIKVVLAGFTYNVKGYKIDNPEQLLYFGYIDIPYMYGAPTYLDYKPSTDLKLYLPFYGLFDLDNVRVLGKRLFIHGVIDFYAGILNYLLSVGDLNEEDPLNSVYIATVSANVSVDVPFFGDSRGANRQQVFADMLFGGARAYSQYINTPQFHRRRKAVQQEGINTIETMYNDSFVSPNEIQNGEASSISGYYAPTKIILYRYAPIPAYAPNSQSVGALYGLPCDDIAPLSIYKGFTVVEEVHKMSIAGATDKECEEIITLLHEGVRFEEGTFYYSVQYNDSHITWSQSTTAVVAGATFTNTFTLEQGYQLDDVVVTMNGNDITSTVLHNQTITIPNVNGNIVITVSTSEIPEVFDVIYNQLVGVTLSNPAVTVTEGETYETNLIPQYSLGYILSSFNYSPIVLQGHVYVPSAYANGTVRITNVSDDIEIRGTFPQVTDMTNQWWYNGISMSLPTEPIDLSNKVVNFDDGNTQYTGNDIIIDNQETGEGYFISFTTANLDSVTIDRSGNIYVNDVLTSHLVNIDFYMPSEYYTSYTGLLPWLDNNFHINFTP